MTGIILAGGKSLRMGGVDKAFLEIDNEPIINRQLKTLKRIFKKIIIVTNSVDRYKDLKRVRAISDVLLGRGPLGGIYSGLLASSSFYNFVIACDMPFIDARLIRYMKKIARGYDVVVPKVDGRYEPLFSIYSKDCSKYIKRLLDKKILKIRGFFPQVKAKVVGRREVSQFISPEKLFTNINTPGDLLRLYA